MTDERNNAAPGDAGQVDFAAALQFLTALDPDPAATFCFQTFDDRRSADKRMALTQVLHATRAQLPGMLERLKGLNALGAGIFVSVNRTDGRGRSAEHIVAIRAQFVDLDGAPLEPVQAADRRPHMVVNTSPGRWHTYWLVSGVTLEDFPGIQDALVDQFHGDRLVRSVAQVMRLPGFFHRKGEPFLTRIESIDAAMPRYRADQFEKRAPVRTPNPNSEPNATLAGMAVSVIPNPDLDWGEYNRIGMAIWRATEGSDEGFQIFDEWASKSNKYNARDTRARWAGYWRSPPQRIGLGTLVWLARQAVPDWEQRVDRQLIADLELACKMSLYDQMGVAHPEQQSAGEPTIQRPAEGMNVELELAIAAQASSGAGAPPPRSPPSSSNDDTPQQSTTTTNAEGKQSTSPTAPPPPKPQQSTPPPRPSDLVYLRMGQIESKRVNWLWPSRIARGKLGLFAGMPDVNKSTLALYTIALCSSGGEWPAGEGRVPRGNVILLTAEDDLADTVRPRLEVAGADLNRVHVVKMVMPANEVSRGFDLTQDIGRLEHLIKQIGDVVLVVIDPVSAYMGKPGKLDSHRATDIRATLSPLHEMAARCGAAVIGIDHLNKTGGKEAMLRIIGSIAFVGAPRSVYLVVRDEEDESRRLFLPVKNNIARIRTGLAFRVVEKMAPPPVSEPYPAIVWEDAVITMTADEALAIKKQGRQSETLEAAKALITELLLNGPRPKREIEERAAERGISDKSLRNAKGALYIRATQAGRQWWWCLPGQELPM